MPKKVRVDRLVMDLGLANDLEQARRLVLAGKVFCGDTLYDKPGIMIQTGSSLFIKGSSGKFVSKGGEKLQQALLKFPVDPRGKTCLDIGASTGGFTDVLLKNEAKEITALDVGYGILDWRIRNDKRVKVIERTNFRKVPDDFFACRFDLIVIDVSFISLEVIVPKAFSFLAEHGDVLALVKPQFEAPKDHVEKGGKVSIPEVRIEIVRKLQADFRGNGIHLWGLAAIEKSDKKKNLEIFSWWKASEGAFSEEEYENWRQRECHENQS